MSDLLAELKALQDKAELPEQTLTIPEWKGRKIEPFKGGVVTLRGFTVREGRVFRKMIKSANDAADQGDEDSRERVGLFAVAFSLVDQRDGSRPLAIAGGADLLDGLSELTVRRLMAAYERVSKIDDAEGNLPPGANADSSSDSLSPSAVAQSGNSSESSARPN